MPEGHTLHRLARLHQRRFGRAPVSVASPQGRFADERRAGQRAGAAQGRRVGQAPVPPLRRRRGSCTCTSGCTAHSPIRDPCRHPDARRAGADADDRRRVRHRPARADGLRGDRRSRDRRRRRQAGARPAAPRCRPGSGVGANHQVPQADRCAADGPGGDRRRRQRLPQRAAVSGTASTRSGPAPRSPPTNSTRCGPTSSR